MPRAGDIWLTRRKSMPTMLLASQCLCGLMFVFENLRLPAPRIKLASGAAPLFPDGLLTCPQNAVCKCGREIPRSAVQALLQRSCMRP